MERLTRLNVNLALLKMHLEQHEASGSKTLDAEVGLLRIGDFMLVTSQEKLTAQIGVEY